MQKLARTIFFDLSILRDLMLRSERLKLIMREINLYNRVLSADLSEKLAVSEDTVRRDLKELADEGVILKVHGGAMSKTFHSPFDGKNQVYALQAKQQIAEKTISLFKKNMLVVMEGGTTIMEIAKKVPGHLGTVFFTPSPQVAITLAGQDEVNVITIGGTLAKNANLHTGASVINELASIKTDLCVIGANGLSVKEGLTDSDWEVVQVLRAMIRSAKKVVVVAIAEKLNSIQRMKVCGLEDIDYLVTELPPESPFLSAFAHEKVQVI